MTDRLERLTNLLANLLDARRPLTLEEIVDVVPGYPDDKVAYRRQFERDKDTLRGIGIPIDVEPLDALGGGEVGYRIRPEEYYLPELDLTPGERAALHVAVTAVRLEGGGGREALFKLGGLEGESAAPMAALRTDPALGELFDAYRNHATVSFSHRGERRRLDPYGLVFRRGRWYVVGHDRDRNEPRSFRVDRIGDDVEIGRPGGFAIPEHLDPASLLRIDPLSFGDDEPIEARLLVDRGYAAWVIEELGEESVLERRRDGSVVLSVPVANLDAFRSFVLGLLDHAEVLDPPAVRGAIVQWLEALAGAAA
jgi:proteasome accessory factor B